MRALLKEVSQISHISSHSVLIHDLKSSFSTFFRYSVMQRVGLSRRSCSMPDQLRCDQASYVFSSRRSSYTPAKTIHPCSAAPTMRRYYNNTPLQGHVKDLTTGMQGRLGVTLILTFTEYLSQFWIGVPLYGAVRSSSNFHNGIQHVLQCNASSSLQSDHTYSSRSAILPSNLDCRPTARQL